MPSAIADHLAVTAMALDDQDRAAPVHKLGMAVGREPPLPDVLDIDRQQADPVRIVAGEIGLDQMIRDEARLTLAAARSRADRPAERVQRGARDGRHQAVRKGKDTPMMYDPPRRDVKARAPDCASPRRRARSVNARREDRPRPDAVTTD
jgi:hypothetical protein